MKTLSLFVALLAIMAPGPRAMAGETPDSTLEAFHQAGNTGNPDIFGALLNHDAVLLGLEDNQRWEGTGLRQSLRDYFSGGGTWSYHPSHREVTLAPGGTTAWFSESLEAGEGNLGWGSGVLVKTDGGWRVSLYHLAATSPGKNTAVASSAAGTDVVADEVVETSGSAPAAAATPAAEPAAPKKRCNKRRHKTNKAASC